MSPRGSPPEPALRYPVRHEILGDAFWRLLTDPQQSALLVESLEAIGSRPFARGSSLRVNGVC